MLLKSDKKLNKGDNAPDFSLKNVDGKTYSLADFKDKVLVVIFIANHCPYARAKMDEISELEREYSDKGAVIVNIASNDPIQYPEDGYEPMKELAKEKGYAHYLHDETQDVARAYGAVCTPDPFVFDKNHKLIYHGRVNDAMSPGDTPNKHDLRAVLDNAIIGKEIENWFVPSVGCSIKWKR